MTRTRVVGRYGHYLVQASDNTAWHDIEQHQSLAEALKSAKKYSLIQYDGVYGEYLNGSEFKKLNSSSKLGNLYEKRNK